MLVRAPRKTIKQDCATILVATLNQAISGLSGNYLDNGIIIKNLLPGLGTAIEKAAKLWKLSENLVLSMIEPYSRSLSSRGREAEI
jgi:hypothetical protein